MTIRYTCDGCESVLKIKDEKAGTKGKCPKCKKEFLVPAPDLRDDNAENAPVIADLPDDQVDMPIELTPEVSESDEFDPLAVLGGSSASKSRASSSGWGESGDRKPSLAEMMKDFEASKKKDKKSAPEVSRPTASSAAYSTMETSGTAADALSKAYQQKRESASSPSKSAKNIKAAEERALLTEFILKKAGPALVAIGVLLYGYWTWMNHETYIGPPLFEVSGQVLKAGSPAAGIEVIFEPIITEPDDPRSVVRATSDPDGNFRLMYDASHYGAPAGEYSISFMNIAGMPIVRSEGQLKQTVKQDEQNVFKINL